MDVGNNGVFKPSTQRSNVSINDKIKDKAQELEGKAKQAIGGATGDDDLQAEGVKDEKSGQLKGVGEKIKDVLS